MPVNGYLIGSVVELVKRLAVAREIEELKLFHGASFIDQIPQVENKRIPTDAR
jgi:hypothetical protein